VRSYMGGIQISF